MCDPVTTESLADLSSQKADELRPYGYYLGVFLQDIQGVKGRQRKASGIWAISDRVADVTVAETIAYDRRLRAAPMAPRENVRVNQNSAISPILG
jgi:hypothetical protein